MVSAVRQIALSKTPIDRYGFVETLFRPEFFRLLQLADLRSLDTTLRIIELPGKVDLKPLIVRLEQIVTEMTQDEETIVSKFQ